MGAEARNASGETRGCNALACCTCSPMAQQGRANTRSPIPSVTCVSPGAASSLWLWACCRCTYRQSRAHCHAGEPCCHVAVVQVSLTTTVASYQTKTGGHTPALHVQVAKYGHPVSFACFFSLGFPWSLGLFRPVPCLPFRLRTWSQAERSNYCTLYVYMYAIRTSHVRNAVRLDDALFPVLCGDSATRSQFISFDYNQRAQSYGP